MEKQVKDWITHLSSLILSFFSLHTIIKLHQLIALGVSAHGSHKGPVQEQTGLLQSQPPEDLSMPRQRIDAFVFRFAVQRKLAR